jgi:uncharacterized protein YjbJ (UPF0337 family)
MDDVSQPHAAVRQKPERAAAAKAIVTALVRLVLVPKEVGTAISSISCPHRTSVIVTLGIRKEHNMDKEHVKGAAEKMKGAIKDQAGKLTDDKKMQAEGKMDKAKGTARKIAGDVKDAARDATEK